MVDGGRELLRQHLGQLIDRNTEARRKLLDGVAAEHLLQLLRRNRQVLAVADPGFDLVAEARLLPCPPLPSTSLSTTGITADSS